MNKQRAIAKLEAILQVFEKDAADRQNNQAWREHTQIVRGNPVRIYVGEEF